MVPKFHSYSTINPQPFIQHSVLRAAILMPYGTTTYGMSGSRSYYIQEPCQYESSALIPYVVVLDLVVCKKRAVYMWGYLQEPCL